MKKIISLLFILTFVFTATLTANAESVKEDTWKELTNEEVKILKKDVGLTMDEIKERPADFLRSLIKEGAVKKFIQKKIVHVKDGKMKDTNGDISPLYIEPEGDLKGDIEMEAEAYEVNSDVPGDSKFRIIGRWKWVSVPQNTFTDGFSIGAPILAGLRVSEEGNEIQEHRHSYMTSTPNGYITHDYGYEPDAYDPNSGVGYTIDLQQGYLDKHFGHMEQYMYSSEPSGNAVIKFEYGHKRLIAESISFDTSGSFGISSSFGIDKGYIVDSLVWN